MPLASPVTFEDAARGLRVTLHPGPPPRIEILHQAGDGSVALQAQVAATAADQQAFDDLAAVMAAPGAAALEEQRLRFANLARRAGLALPTAARALQAGVHWLLGSREDTNYTYHLTPQNRLHLAHLVAVVTGRPLAEILGYFAELEGDAALQAHVGQGFAAQPLAGRAVSDAVARYGRRIGWYAMVRAQKPRLVIETGVDKGLGAIVLCAALRRNREAGHPGRYLGTDIRREAGALLTGAYAEVGRVAYGDSLATLREVTEPIDLFINDSDHSAAYEAQEYATIAPRLSPHGVVLGDNAHSTDALANFAQETDRRFVFFKELPADHFYPGAGIGFAYR